MSVSIGKKNVSEILVIFAIHKKYSLWDLEESLPVDPIMGL